METAKADGDFIGAKLALFLGDQLVVILRDDTPTIPFPGHWDLPGGGREAGEAPATCALRETAEEIGLTLLPADLTYGRRYDTAEGVVWFFAAHLPAARAGDIRFGDEGQGWELMTPAAYLAHDLAVPSFQTRLRHYLDHPGRDLDG